MPDGRGMAWAQERLAFGRSRAEQETSAKGGALCILCAFLQKFKNFHTNIVYIK